MDGLSKMGLIEFFKNFILENIKQEFSNRKKRYVQPKKAIRTTLNQLHQEFPKHINFFDRVFAEQIIPFAFDLINKGNIPNLGDVTDKYKEITPEGLHAEAELICARYIEILIEIVLEDPVISGCLQSKLTYKVYKILDNRDYNQVNSDAKTIKALQDLLEVRDHEFETILSELGEKEIPKHERAKILIQHVQEYKKLKEQIKLQKTEDITNASIYQNVLDEFEAGKHKNAHAILQKLRELHNHPVYVFPSRNSRNNTISNNTILMALDRMGYRGKMTGHGFRALAMSTIMEKLHYRHEVPDAQLAHAKRGDVARAYDRAKFLPERIKMMQEWADYLDNISRNGQIILGKFG